MVVLIVAAPLSSQVKSRPLKSMQVKALSGQVMQRHGKAADVKPLQAPSGPLHQVKSGQGKSRPVKASQVKSGQGKSRQVKASQGQVRSVHLARPQPVEPCQGKSRQVRHRQVHFIKAADAKSLHVKSSQLKASPCTSSLESSSSAMSPYLH